MTANNNHAPLSMSIQMKVSLKHKFGVNMKQNKVEEATARRKVGGVLMPRASTSMPSLVAPYYKPMVLKMDATPPIRKEWDIEVE